MTPRYTWTPASEPPDTARKVVGWLSDNTWMEVQYRNRHWRDHDGFCFTVVEVTYWHDVKPPEGAS